MKTIILALTALTLAGCSNFWEEAPATVHDNPPVCRLSSDEGSADSRKPHADPWTFGADGGAGPGTVPYLHVNRDYGCLLY